MKPTPECVALLRAIAATPDDDTPRLVFADWLDENAAGDADAARAAFIRLSCTMKSKQRLSTAEGKWLDANVRRLLPTVMEKFKKAKVDEGISRSGRNVRISTSLDPEEEYGDGRIFLHVEFWRGFARRIEYGAIPPATSFKNVGRELAADEPLAIHMPEVQEFPGSMSEVERTIRVNPNICSEVAVWKRVKGHARIDGEEKIFVFSGVEGGQWVLTGQDVARNSISQAMTSIARESSGWPAKWVAEK